MLFQQQMCGVLATWHSAGKNSQFDSTSSIFIYRDFTVVLELETEFEIEISIQADRKETLLVRI